MASDLTRILANNFLTLSQLQTKTLATMSGVVAYFARPRIVLISHARLRHRRNIDRPLGSSVPRSIFVSDSPRVERDPGQSVVAPFMFNLTRGIFENLIEPTRWPRCRQVSNHSR